jgi:hypothetical protein
MAKLYWRYKKDGKWTWKAALDNKTGEILEEPRIVEEKE